MKYTLAVFNSRTQTMSFYNKLKKHNVPCSITNTPNHLKMACGICVKFFSSNMSIARALINNELNTFIGFLNSN